MPRIEVVQGDITQQRVDAIVNAANRAMRGGGGVDGAIHRAGGPTVLADCIARFPDGLATGDAGATVAGSLPAHWVIHTVGPNYCAGQTDRELLVSCYRRALEVADELGAMSVAFPLISAGIYGWPLEDALQTAVSTVARAATSVQVVRFVSPDTEITKRIHRAALSASPIEVHPGSIGALFTESPPQYGMRGDSYLWLELRSVFAASQIPGSAAELDALLRAEVAKHVDLSVGAPVQVPYFNPGSGMTAGWVSTVWWDTFGIPLLIDRAGL